MEPNGHFQAGDPATSPRSMLEASPEERDALPQPSAVVNLCPVCDGQEWEYVMNAHGLTFFACGNCRLMRVHPLPSPKTLETIQQRRAAWPATPETSEEELERARTYWTHLQAHLGARTAGRRILLLSSEPESLLRAGPDLGFSQIEPAADVEALPAAADGSFDACLAVFAIERTALPAASIERLHRLLKPGGKLLIVTPLLDSWPARFCRDAWTELRPENRFYFSAENLQTLLLRHGFARIWAQPDRRRYTLGHLYRQARIYPTTGLTRLVRAFCGLLPSAWRNRIRLPLPTSAFIVTATKTEARVRPKLSIVMPVYNEKTTFEECFRAVRAKTLAGLDKEIIVVESNSSDGTRALVQTLCTGDSSVRVIFQERAAGKGNAVRAGLQAVEGDIVLIQDADLEYDVNDYDALVRPILEHRAALVLGSRHTGTWKMRKFNDQPLIASFFNLGHLFFCTSLNLLYGQAMKDPFTMYKVFRADCLHGLELECNRFDFDFEILIKLLRKGYQPLEVPVNYQARSLTEGKKVTAFRDPLTWLRALVKYRFCKIGPPPLPRSVLADAHSSLEA